ncbi:MAG: hypothetical protein ACI3XP_02335 [Eubacteriales bacterium]
MKNGIVTFLVCLPLLALLAACGSSPEESGTSAPPETDAPQNELLLFDGAATDYVIIRGEDADQKETNAAIRLRDALKERGIQTKIATDWEGNGVFPHEIVVGQTIRTAAEGNTLDFHSVGPEGYFLRAAGERLYICGGSPDATALAVEEFLTEFLPEDPIPMTAPLCIPAGYERIVRQEFSITSLTLNGTPLGEFAVSVETRDTKGKLAARAMQDALYAECGVWLPLLSRGEEWDGHKVVLSADAPAVPGTFEACAENGDLILRTDVAGAFRRGILAFLGDAVGGKSGSVELGADYRFTDAVGSYVLYSDYGAVGDGKTNDIAAIAAAHAYANQNGLAVRADRGATYYIGAADTGAVIQTDTDWSGASFIIDDSAVPPDKRGVYIFSVRSALPSFSVLDRLQGTTIREGQESLPLTLEQSCVLALYDDNTRRYFREGVNANSGFVQQEIFVVGKDGSVDAGTPVVWDWTGVTAAQAYPIDEQTLTIRGGTFTTLVNTQKSEPKFYQRGIGIFRSNVVIDGVSHYVEDDGRASAPYYGFFNTEKCAYVTIQNCTLTPHWTHINDPLGHGFAPQGTYDLCSTMAAYLTYQDCSQSIDIMDDTYWGIMASKFCKSITLDGCTFSRFDTHEGVVNATIRNCTLGYQGLNAIGFGTLLVENTTCLCDDRFISLRSDYGSTWKGDLILKNCTWTPGGGKTLTSGSSRALITGSYNAFHDYGYACYMPKNIVIDGLHINDAKNAFGYNGIYLLGNIIPADTGAAYENKVRQNGGRFYHITETLTVSGFTSESGRDWRLSPNEYMYRDVAVTDLDP